MEELNNSKEKKVHEQLQNIPKPSKKMDFEFFLENMKKLNQTYKSNRDSLQQSYLKGQYYSVAKEFYNEEKLRLAQSGQDLEFRWADFCDKIGICVSQADKYIRFSILISNNEWLLELDRPLTFFNNNIADIEDIVNKTIE